MRFNGLSQSDLKIIISEPTDILGKASLRYEKIEIDGSSSAQYHFLGYSTIKRTLLAQLLDPEETDLILETFNGPIEIEFNNRITSGMVLNSIDVERMVFLRKLSISIERSPFWYKKEDPYVLVTNEVVNEGTVESKPLIKLIKGSSQVVEIKIGDVQFEYDFKSDNEVLIDCEDKNAYLDGLFRNKQLNIGYDFPVLKVGTNYIQILRGDPQIQIKRKDVWL